MQTIQAGYQGLTLLFDLNWDRILYVAAIVGALFLGGWIGSIISTTAIPAAF